MKPGMLMSITTSAGTINLAQPIALTDRHVIAVQSSVDGFTACVLYPRKAWWRFWAPRNSMRITAKIAADGTVTLQAPWWRRAWRAYWHAVVTPLTPEQAQEALEY